MNDERRELTFVLRIWITDPDPRASSWRGFIHEVRTGKRLFVTGVHDIADFIAAHLTTRA